MYTITKFVLDNGQEFNSEKEARKALDNLYGNALEKLAHSLCKCNGKYSEILACLDNNFELMQNIIALKQELKIGLIDND